VVGKADMQKRGQASPDDGDALALTFAQTVAPANVEEEGRGRIRAVQWQELGVDAMTPPDR
jgi:tartrate dehydratase beta subunit/fumarate hydratase class I family protein